MFRKRFCFSSQARNVTIAIALIDMVFGFVLTIVSVSFLYIFINYPETLRKMVTENPAKQKDLEKLLAWGPYKQAVTLAIPIIASLTNVFMGTFLLVIAKRRHLKGTRLWLILTIIFCVISMIFFIPEWVFTQEKYALIIFSLIDYIYNAYSIWIVHSFISEMSSQQTGSNSLSSVLPYADDLDFDTELTSSINTNTATNF